MFIADNYSLVDLNAFRFDHSVKLYVECENDEALLEFALDFTNDTTADKRSDSEIIVFGEGSNTVLTKDIEGPVVRFTGDTVSITAAQDKACSRVHVQAGKNWHEFVLEMVQHGLQGVENLSLIPGTCGAAPVQNIGAYGVELSDTLESVSALHWPTKKMVVLKSDDCQFGYRDSRFKQHPGEFIITGLTLLLRNQGAPVTSYDALDKALSENSIKNPTPQQISDLVCDIRRSKLPDPLTLPNAGSFFKNPLITDTEFQALAAKYPKMPYYRSDAGQIKIAAGWLIENAGLKGYRHPMGHVSVYDKQALVLVHHGEGSAKELLELAEHIRTTVHETFGISLEREPVLR